MKKCLDCCYLDGFHCMAIGDVIMTPETHSCDWFRQGSVGQVNPPDCPHVSTHWDDPYYPNGWSCGKTPCECAGVNLNRFWTVERPNTIKDKMFAGCPRCGDTYSGSDCPECRWIDIWAVRTAEEIWEQDEWEQHSN